MDKYIERLELILENLDTFKWIMSGGDASTSGNHTETVSRIVKLYESDIVELKQLFGDIKREFGSVKTCELKPLSSEKEE